MTEFWSMSAWKYYGPTIYHGKIPTLCNCHHVSQDHAPNSCEPKLKGIETVSPLYGKGSYFPSILERLFNLWSHMVIENPCRLSFNYFSLIRHISLWTGITKWWPQAPSIHMEWRFKCRWTLFPRSIYKFLQYYFDIQWACIWWNVRLKSLTRKVV